MREAITSYLKKALLEHKSSTLAVFVLLALAVVCIFGSISVTSPNFKLPQPALGLGLLAVVSVLVLLSFYAHHLAANSTQTSDALRKKFTDDVIMKNIRVEVSGDGEGMSFWKNDEGGELRAWLDVVNFNPFPIEIDRIVGEVTVRGSVVAELSHLLRPVVEATSAQRVFVRTKISPEDVKKIAFQLSQSGSLNDTGFRLNLWVESAVAKVQLHRNLTTSAYRFVNFDLKGELRHHS